ncbi:hypothetical protein WA026_016050 [Henosepilachna vigintioctopunctata]|uniref:SCP domain-containing protein n=1 Tax=Henosepilachna vigintioctopunctata TaxID=420089 RepID=A0AAW1U2B6_9CUCU
MFTLLTYTLVFINFLLNVRANHYCHLSKSHTMCRYAENKIPDNCSEYQRIELRMEDKSDIVDIHNNLRNFVASGGFINELGFHFPEASAMNALKWNDELAEFAQRWVDQCLLDESRDKNRNMFEFSVDQMVINLEISTEDNLPHFPEIFMSSWSKNFHHFSLNDIIDFNTSRDINKYVPLIWDITEYIGCAMITFKNPSVTNKDSAHILKTVCNYGPSGNLKTPPIYKIGQPCSLCDSKKCDETYQSLCISNGNAQFPEGRNKVNDDVRRVMLEKYNMLQNGDECYCVDKLTLTETEN